MNTGLLSQQMKRFSAKELLGAMNGAYHPSLDPRLGIISQPKASVYISAASGTGLPLRFSVDTTERGITDPTITPELARAYEKTVANAKPGEVNGDSSSVARMKFDRATNEFVLELRPTKFFMGRAVANELSTQPLDFLEAHTPNMLNVSLVVITEIGGKKYLICQEKGKAIGSGALHTFFAGNVTAKNLSSPNPLHAGLITQARDELGLELNPTHLKPVALVNELQLGMFNVAFAAFAPNFDGIRAAFEASTKARLSKLKEAGQVEVRGIGVTSVNALLAVPLEDGKPVLSGPVKMFRATDDGSLAEMNYEKRPVRPYWEVMSKLIIENPGLVDAWAENFRIA